MFRAAIAVTGLLIDAAWNRVVGVTGAPPGVTTPKPRAHSISPAWITAMLAPGTPRRAISSASTRLAGGAPATDTAGSRPRSTAAMRRARFGSSAADAGRASAREARQRREADSGTGREGRVVKAGLLCCCRFEYKPVAGKISPLSLLLHTEMTTAPATPVRTRFAPSPTGFLHLGGARTALYSWAFARHFGGTFVLRIEDTDVERSTPGAVQAIIDGMQWLGLDHDEGPFYQMQRMDRYREVIGQMLAAGTAYHCYSSPEEVEAMRERFREAGEKPRYDGTWRPEEGKTLPAIPEGRKPVVRFKNPLDGDVTWNDVVKGTITISNRELDDLVIDRPDGTPTYNFCVAVDDWDMRISHVLRGDDHVNNTPRQINILRAIGAPLPLYGHLPMILGADGQKLSKRKDAVNVMEYPAQGYLPEAVLNYLARLGWSHGDDEVFSKQQFAQWFDLDHITPSAAQFNTEKLNWLNAHYIKQADNDYLARDITKRLKGLNIAVSEQPNLSAVIELYKERVNTLNELASNIAYFYQKPVIDQAAAEKHLTADIKPVMATLVESLTAIDWQAEQIHHVINEVVTQYQLKFPKVAMPLRVMVTGIAQSPSIDQVMALLGKDEVLARINSAMN